MSDDVVGSLLISFEVMVTGRGSGRLEESKCHSYLQKRQEGRHGDIQTDQPHLSIWEGAGDNPPEKHFQTHEGQGDQE